ncbi:MAG: hypothetical protein ACRDKU_08965 [Gaiellaceae bacterium]
MSRKCATAQTRSRLFSRLFGESTLTGLDAGHASRAKTVLTAVSFFSFAASGPT